MNWIFFFLAIVAGMCMPTQAAVNSKLATYVHHPILSAFISFGIGFLALLVYILVSGIPVNQLGGARHAPLIAWIGGLLGAFFVTAVVISVPRLGVALTFSVLILGQMLATLPIDHVGWLGVAVREINVTRIIGVILIIGGVILVRLF